jgi:hypothetical protein
MARVAQITQARYQVEIQCGFEFNKGIQAAHPELETHRIVLQERMNTRDALYVGRTKAIWLHYKAAESKMIQYVDVMSLIRICASISSSL